MKEDAKRESAAVRAAQLALLRELTPGQRIERQATLCRQLAELRRAGAKLR